MRRAAVPLLILACIAAVGWVHVLPLQLRGAAVLADAYARQDVEVRLYQAAHGRVSARELQAQADQWIRTNGEAYQQQLAAKLDRITAAHRFTGGDNREYAYLGDEDSYTWLRLARNYLQHGSTCDIVVNGNCRDTFVNAPLGVTMIYGRSLHIAAIVVLQRIIEWFHPGYPLSATSFWVSVLLAMLSVIPAFVIGQRLGGRLGGVGAALLVSFNPLVLMRTIGSDNDVWNVFLPLCMVAAAFEALEATQLRRRLVWSIAGAFFAALHATTWSGWFFTYVVLIVGLAASGGLQVVRAFAATATRRPQPRGQAEAATSLWGEPLRSTVVVTATFLLASIVLVGLLAPDQLDFGVMARLTRLGSGGGASAPPSTVAEAGVWPAIMATVDELQKSDLSSLAAITFGQPYLLLAFVGVLLMALPRRRWRRIHLAVFVGGTLLSAWLVRAGTIGMLPVLFFATLPVAAGLMTSIARRDDSERETTGAAIIVIVWWLAALFATFSGVRFILLLAPSMAVAIGVVIGRVYEQLTGMTQRLQPQVRRGTVFALAVLLFCVYLPAAQSGYVRARDYLSPIDDSWWDTLTNLREKTPPEAIVDAWWDYGYWVKYVAERRVAADGGTLQTHLPYWLGRILVSADETESAGLLRMLSCGSDATPLPEGRQGAYGKLHAKLKDAVSAQAMVIELAKRDRDAAAAYLGEHGFTAAEQEDVLASTHCAAPETYLIIGTDMTRKDSWMRLAAWDFRRAYIAHEANSRAQDEVVTDVSQRFGYSTQEAAALYDQARRLSREEFVIGPAPRAPSVWYPCRPSNEPSTLHCPLGLFDMNTKKLIEEFVVDTADPRRSYFSYRQTEAGQAPSAPLQMAPGALVVAEATLQDVTLPTPRFLETGVLFDTHDWRILVGPPPLIRSTFTHLLFLNGRYAKHFQKFDERQSYNGDHLVTWRVKF